MRALFIVVVVGLVRVPRPQHPNPRGQHRRNVKPGLAASNKLLSNQVAETVRGLDRPFPFLEPCRPRAEPVRLDSRSSKFELIEHLFVVVDRDRGMGCLVWIDSDHGHGYAFLAGW